MDQQAGTLSATTHAAPAPRVGVGVLLVDHRQHVLLTLRILPPEADCWSIVGGKLDYLESLEHCAIREAREEVSVDIAIQSLLCVTEHRYGTSRPRRASALDLSRVSRSNPSRQAI
jgi:ADP-ribose pyrophosphatase YjhB (NUDIX family)